MITSHLKCLHGMTQRLFFSYAGGVTCCYAHNSRNNLSSMDLTEGDGVNEKIYLQDLSHQNQDPRNCVS